MLHSFTASPRRGLLPGDRVMVFLSGRARIAVVTEVFPAGLVDLALPPAGKKGDLEIQKMSNIPKWLPRQEGCWVPLGCPLPLPLPETPAAERKGRGVPRRRGPNGLRGLPPPPA